MKSLATISLIQGIYYLVTGLWPLVHIDSFMLVTGNVTDIRLIKTVGLLVTVIAITLLFSRFRVNDYSIIFTLGILCTLVFSAVDLYYTFAGELSKIYIIDAVVQIALFFMWISAAFKKQDNTGEIKK